MQFKAVLLALFTVSVTAQDPSGLPECAKPCFLENLAKTGCSSKTDFKCICASKPYHEAVTTCVLGQCQPDDVQKTYTWSAEQCNALGVPFPPQSKV